jgi:hypothetical protein
MILCQGLQFRSLGLSSLNFSVNPFLRRFGGGAKLPQRCSDLGGQTPKVRFDLRKLRTDLSGPRELHFDRRKYLPLLRNPFFYL